MLVVRAGLEIATSALSSDALTARRWYLPRRYFTRLFVRLFSSPHRLKHSYLHFTSQTRLLIFRPKQCNETNLRIQEVTFMRNYHFIRGGQPSKKKVGDNLHDPIMKMRKSLYLHHLMSIAKIQLTCVTTILRTERWLVSSDKMSMLHGCGKIWILCSSGKNRISRTSAANVGNIVFATRT